TFERSAAAFDSPDHVSIAAHNYRWRLGMADGEAKYDELKKRLAAFPPIGIQTITLEGDANGAPHSDPSAYAASSPESMRTGSSAAGSGTTCRRKPPKAFAQAAADVH